MVRTTGKPAPRMMENWEHITAKSFSLICGWNSSMPVVEVDFSLTA